MVTLDLRTLFITLVVVCLTCAALTAGLSTINNRRGTLSALAGSEAMLGIGFGLIGLRNLVPDVGSILLANVLILGGLAGHWLTARRLFGLRFPLPMVLAVLGVTAAAQAWFTFGAPSLPSRIALVSAVCGLATGAVARDALRFRQRAGWVLVLPYALFTALMLVRAGSVLLDPMAEAMPFLYSGDVQATYVMLTLVLQLWMVLGLLWSLGMDWYSEVAGAIQSRIRSEDQLRHSESRLRGLLALDSACIAFLDPAGRIVDANPALCRLLGLSGRRDLIGTTLSSYTLPEDRERETLLHRALVDGQIRSYRIRKHFQTGAGWPISTDLMVAPLRADSDGHLTGFVVLGLPAGDRVQAGRSDPSGSLSSDDDTRSRTESLPDDDRGRQRGR